MSVRPVTVFLQTAFLWNRIMLLAQTITLKLVLWQLARIWTNWFSYHSKYWNLAFDLQYNQNSKCSLSALFAHNFNTQIRTRDFGVFRRALKPLTRDLCIGSSVTYSGFTEVSILQHSDQRKLLVASDFCRLPPYW